MKRLHLLRHAKSSWEDDSLPDRERPLAPRGVKASARMAAHIAAAGVSVELVVCSPARRARDTLELVLPALGKDVQVRTEPAVYGGDAAALLQIVRGLPQEVESALVVGHNPGLESFARQLAAEGQPLGKLAKKYPTGALASFELEVRRWSRVELGRARLEAFVRPRQLD